MKSVINNETLPQAMWDEENRLKHVYDEEYTLSSYLYDAGGERTLKLWDGYQYMMINGEQQIGFFDITDYTLYTSPYMVLTPEQYTKHYYAESDRIVSKIGGGMANNIYQINEVVTGFNIQDHGGYHQKSNQLMEMFARDYDQLYVQADVNANFDYWLNDAINQDEPEEMIFFYHKDLPKAFGMGSSTQISDPGANIIQHIEYLPYGELFFERRDYWNTPYKFNAKELDAETGMYYYGARYYTPEVSIWLSVDPLAREYPSLSPYAYCGGNPIKYIDPDGNWFTEPERRKAIERAKEHVSKGTYYVPGGMYNPPGRGNDCSGMISEVLNYVGYVNHRGAGVDGATNGVARIVSTSKEIEMKNLEVGSLVTFRTGRSDHRGPNGKYDHIGIVSGINRDEEGNLLSFSFIHSYSGGTEEFIWDMQKGRSDRWDASELLLTGAYKWDRENVVNLRMFEITDQRITPERIAPIRPSGLDLPEQLEYL